MQSVAQLVFQANSSEFESRRSCHIQCKIKNYEFKIILHF